MCDWCIILCYFCCLITLEENGVSGLFVSSTHHPVLFSSPILPPPYSPILPPPYLLLPSSHLLPPTCHPSPITHPHIRLASTNLTCFIPFPSPPPSHLFCNTPSLPTCKFSTRKSRTYSTPLLKHSISKNRTFFLIPHYYHFTMKT